MQPVGVVGQHYPRLSRFPYLPSINAIRRVAALTVVVRSILAAPPDIRVKRFVVEALVIRLAVDIYAIKCVIHLLLFERFSRRQYHGLQSAHLSQRMRCEAFPAAGSCSTRHESPHLAGTLWSIKAVVNQLLLNFSKFRELRRERQVGGREVVEDAGHLAYCL